MSVGAKCLRLQASLRTSVRALSPATRRNLLQGTSRASAWRPLAQPPLSRSAGRATARFASTESPSKTNAHRVYVKHAAVPYAVAIGLAASSLFGAVLYWSKSGQPKPDPPISVEPISLTAGKHCDSCATSNVYEPVEGDSLEVTKLPKEKAVLTTAPNVPPPITRDYSVLLQVPLVTTTKLSQLTSAYKYHKWTFNGTVPGPFVRARVGDVVELSLTNKDEAGNPHNIDCHAFTGPGGGAALTTVEENETKTARFKLLSPGLYVYHCAAAPVPVHIANGMYGLLYVQPEKDLPRVDREYYVMQSEFYHEPPEVLENGHLSDEVEFSYPNGLREEPNVVVFNGSESALTRDHPLKGHVNESIRIFFGNAGPNLTSSFHVIGGIFDKIYQSVVDPPSHAVQTVTVPPGGSTITDLKISVPGTYTLVDHAIFRLDKGAVGFLNVSGPQRPDIYQSAQPPAPCTGCKLHS